MPESAEKPEEEPFGLAAARVLEVRAAEVFSPSRGVLDVEDIERVHDMRVATRRLRAALEVFRPCFPKQRLKAAMAEVKELGSALGERRDRDVAIVSLEEFAVEMGTSEREGIERLIERLRAEQAQANRELAQAVHGRRLQALRVRLEDLAAAARRGAGVEPEDEPGPEPPEEPGEEAVER